MSKKEGTKTVVIGGKKEIPQQYSGIVGGQSVDFSTVDTDIKVKLSVYSTSAVVNETPTDCSPKEQHSCTT